MDKYYEISDEYTPKKIPSRPPQQKIAVLYAMKTSGYYEVSNCDVWDEERDARKYNSTFPIIAHPPCQRWSVMWWGGPTAKKRYKLGDDHGCFRSALAFVRKYGGVIEHPMYTRAYQYFNIAKPPLHGGWRNADEYGGVVCQVNQRFYGHIGNKPTWLYACHATLLPFLQSQVRTDARYTVIKRKVKPGGRWRKETTMSQQQNEYTPAAFKQVLIDIASSVEVTNKKFAEAAFKETMSIPSTSGCDWNY